MTDPGLVSVTAPAPAGAHAAPDPAPATAPGSPLGLLRDRRAKLVDQLFIDLRVPRWHEDGGPQIFVRYAPAAPSKVQARVEKAQKQGKRDEDWMVRENAQVLVSSCLGVWAWEGEGDPLELIREAGKDADKLAAIRGQQLSLRNGEPHGDWTKFDTDLAFSLGLPENCGAIAVARALYLTEADLTSAAAQLMRWSGVVAPSEGQDFFGS